MKYAVLFLAGSVAAAVVAFSGQPISPLLLWCSLSLGTVAVGYGGLGARVFGKKPTGTMAPVAVVALAPYLALTWLVWHSSRLLRREGPFNRLAEGVTIGRRLLAAEYPPFIEAVVDLTAEFPEPRIARSARGYWAFPILDGTAPAVDALVGLIAEIGGFPGELYIHCAEGHGRTALVAASLLLMRGDVGSADEAVERVLEQRPGAHMNRVQRRALDSLAMRCAEESITG